MTQKEKNPTVKVAILPLTHSRLTSYCEEQGMKLGALANWIIAEWLEVNDVEEEE